MEDAFGLNPAESNPGSVLPNPVIMGNNFTVTFSQPAGVTGVTYGAQWTQNLASWSSITDTRSAGNRTFTVNRLGISKVFFRHQIAASP